MYHQYIALIPNIYHVVFSIERNLGEWGFKPTRVQNMNHHAKSLTSKLVTNTWDEVYIRIYIRVNPQPATLRIGWLQLVLTPSEQPLALAKKPIIQTYFYTHLWDMTC